MRSESAPASASRVATPSEPAPRKVWKSALVQLDSPARHAVPGAPRRPTPPSGACPEGAPRAEDRDATASALVRPHAVVEAARAMGACTRAARALHPPHAALGTATITTEPVCSRVPVPRTALRVVMRAWLAKRRHDARVNAQCQVEAHRLREGRRGDDGTRLDPKRRPAVEHPRPRPTFTGSLSSRSTLFQFEWVFYSPQGKEEAHELSWPWSIDRCWKV